MNIIVIEPIAFDKVCRVGYHTRSSGQMDFYKRLNNKNSSYHMDEERCSKKTTIGIIDESHLETVHSFNNRMMVLYDDYRTKEKALRKEFKEFVDSVKVDITNE